MAKTKKYCYIRMEPADNGGVVLTFEEKMPAPGGGCYSGYNSFNRTEVYDETKINEAVSRMVSLTKQYIEIEDEKSEEGKSMPHPY